MTPMISLVIPTRERSETLKFTIETAINQRTDNFEVIISDNFSQDDTKEVVASFTDSRIKYINTGQRLSMCDNWDFALEHVSGQYVVFIGDDDAVMPDALEYLQDFVNVNPSLVYTWPLHYYRWPMEDRGASFEFGVCSKNGASEVDLTKTPRLVVSMGGWRFDANPSVYHSAISKDILDKIRIQTGRVFHSMMPDIFTGLAVPAFTERAINTGFSITLAGHSRKSNGGSRFTQNGAQVIKNFIREYGEYKIHPTLFPGVPIIANMIPDTVLVAIDKFPQFYHSLKFNYNAMWALMCRLGPLLKYQLGHQEIIQKRQQIRCYHPLNTGKFLLYATFHKAAGWRQEMLKRKPRVGFVIKPVAGNIRDFVKQFSDLRENGQIARV